DIDVRANARLAGDGQIRNEVTDHMAGAVLEARILSVPVHTPAEHARVEPRGRLDVVGRYAQVGNPGGPKDSGFAFVSRGHGRSEPTTRIGASVAHSATNSPSAPLTSCGCDTNMCSYACCSGDRLHPHPPVRPPSDPGQPAGASRASAGAGARTGRTAGDRRGLGPSRGVRYPRRDATWRGPG